jgi:hypothetical protein
MINQPVLCITSDIDWASPACTQDFIELLGGYGITPTLFATHDCPVVRDFHAKHPHDVGVHPNFRANSTHGSDWQSVIDHVFDLFPSAKTFRSHAYYDSTDILREMLRRGVTYDSNLCLYLQPNIVPLQLGIPGMTRFPVFWEEDCHWQRSDSEWEFRDFAEAFTSPGLKIINVHPFMIATNAPSEESYAKTTKHITTATPKELDDLRHRGAGSRTFLVELIEFALSQGLPFYTLHQLNEKFPVNAFL